MVAVETGLSTWCLTDEWRLGTSLLVLSSCSVEPVPFQICIKILCRNWQEYRKISTEVQRIWKSFLKEGLRKRIILLVSRPGQSCSGESVCGHEEVMEWRKKTQSGVIRREPVRKYLQFRCDRGSLLPHVYKVSTNLTTIKVLRYFLKDGRPAREHLKNHWASLVTWDITLKPQRQVVGHTQYSSQGKDNQ